MENSLEVKVKRNVSVSLQPIAWRLVSRQLQNTEYSFSNILTQWTLSNTILVLWINHCHKLLENRSFHSRFIQNKLIYKHKNVILSKLFRFNCRTSSHSFKYDNFKYQEFSYLSSTMLIVAQRWICYTNSPDSSIMMIVTSLFSRWLIASLNTLVRSKNGFVVVNGIKYTTMFHDYGTQKCVKINWKMCA